MISKLIKSEKEILEFAKMYEKLSKRAIDANLTYLSKAKVRGFYQNNHLAGGYAVSTVDLNDSLRYIDLIDPNERELIKIKDFKLSQAVEITYTFMNNDLLSPLQNSWIMIRSLCDASLFYKKYMLGGGVVKKFNDRMKSVFNIEFFSGETTIKGQTSDYMVLCQKSLFVPIFAIYAFIKELFSKVFRIKKSK